MLIYTLAKWHPCPMHGFVWSVACCTSPVVRHAVPVRIVRSFLISGRTSEVTHRLNRLADSSLEERMSE